MVKLRAKNFINHQYKDFCCIGISLHSTNHTGENFEAIINYINENFKFCLIDLSDTLYTHHYISTHKLNPTEAYFQAREDGEKWLKDNQESLAKLKIPYQIVRWEHWKNSSEYSETKLKFDELFEYNLVFRNAVLSDIYAYYKRRYNRDVSNVDPKFLKSSISYLLEELSCHTILFKDYPCTNIYPGKQLKCYEVIRNGEIQDAPFGIQKSYHLRLNLYISPAAKSDEAYHPIAA